jgi:parallel beta-helix repeat protein
MKRKAVWQMLAMLAALAGIVFLTSVYAATLTLYVSPTGVNSPTCGTSDTNPCKTITYTLTNRVTGPAAVIKLAAGTYKESLIITSKVTLSGAGAATTIIAGSGVTPNPPTIKFTGERLEITGVTIRGGNPGVSADRAILNAQNCIFTGNTDGVSATSNSSSIFNACTFKGNSGDGVGIGANSSAIFNKCLLTLNGNRGIRIYLGSSAELNSNTVTSNNHGVAVTLNSGAQLEGNTISGNKQTGLIVHKQSAAQLAGGNKIYSNGQSKPGNAGVAVYNASHVYFQKGSVKDTIYNNLGQGINVAFNGDLYMESNSATITTNKSHGVQLTQDSGAHFDSGVAITNNLGWGLLCDGASGGSKYSGTPTVTGNALGQISCSKYF